MKKLHLLLCFVLASFLLNIPQLFSLSPSIQFLSYENEVISDQAMRSTATIENISSEPIVVGLMVVKSYAVEGHEISSYFAGEYSGPSTDTLMVSTGILTLMPGQESSEDDFYLELNPNGIEGESVYQVLFFLISDDTDFAQYEVKFICSEDYTTPDVQIIHADIHLFGYDLWESYKSYAILKNNSSNTVEIGLKIILLSKAENHVITHCYGGNCYGPSFNDTTISEGTLILQPGQESLKEDFDVELNPNGEAGQTSVKLVFFSVESGEFFDEYEVLFDIEATSVSEDNALSSFAYPNPASNFINFDLSDLTGNIEIKVFNSQASLMSDYSISSPNGVHSLNCADYPQGVYNFLILKDGKLFKQGRFAIMR